MEKVFWNDIKKRINSVIAFILAIIVIMPLSAIETFATDNIYSFTTINDKTVYSCSSDYDITINVFGRDTCTNTKNMLKSIIDLGYDTTDGIKVNFVDCNSDIKEVVAEFSEDYSNSLIDFCYDTGSSANNAMWYYARLAGAENSVSLPVTAFVNGDGTIRKITTGAVSESYLTNIINNGEFLDESLSFSITGTNNYDYAYTVLDSLNETRSALGLNELEMDKGLLDIAMQRAAEISIYYSHTRPNNDSCFSLASGYGSMGENIAIGQTSPQRVMTAWTNSSGHYANMVDDIFNSVGIGCFKASNGVYCWVQFFSSEEADLISKSGSVETSHNITALFCNLSLCVSPSSVSLPLAENGDKFSLTVENKNVCFSYAVQKLDASNFNYSSSDSNIVSAGNSGEYTIKNKGEAILTLSLKSNSNIEFICPVELGHNHNYSEWIIDKEATVNAAGKKHKECTECGEVLETATIKQLKCSKPKLSKIENTEHGVLIKWNKVSGADSYDLYRKVKGGSYSKVGTTNKTYFTDKKAKSGKKYYYVVKAVNEAGSSDSSKSLSKYYLADPTLKTPSSTKSGVSLKWTKATGAQGYIIYRKTGSGSYKKLKTEKGVSNLSYVDKSAKKGKKYTYKVKAYYSKTYSAYSNTKTIKDKY